MNLRQIAEFSRWLLAMAGFETLEDAVDEYLNATDQPDEEDQ